MDKGRTNEYKRDKSLRSPKGSARAIRMVMGSLHSDDADQDAQCTSFRHTTHQRVRSSLDTGLLQAASPLSCTPAGDARGGAASASSEGAGATVHQKDTFG